MRRPILAPALALACALAAPAGARADDTLVSMPGKYFSPPHVTIVPGDRVTWRNADLAIHNVRIESGPFESGPLGRSGSWTHAFEQPGGYPYACTLHPFMNGNVDVVTATLTGPTDAVLAGEPLFFAGRAPAGTPHVALERSAPGGGWTPVGAGTAPVADGTFTLAAPAVEGASYRVVTPAGAGAAVTPQVTARIDVHLMVAHGKRRTTVHVHTMPATTGFVVTLQLYARWHFRWRDNVSARLDRHGGAMFRVPRALRAYARVTLSRRPGGPALAHSGTVKLWNGRHARDPDEIGMPMPGGAGHHHGG
jgi:plastocyanin